MSTTTLTKLMLAVLLITAVAMAVTAVRAADRSVDEMPAQATPPGSSEWHRVDLDAFAVWLPPGWTYVERQGIDSFVGDFVGDGVTLGFDYGRYSNPLPEPGAPGYDVFFEEIGGKQAKLVVAQSAPATETGVHFAEVTRDRVGCDSFVVDKLTVTGTELEGEQRETALAIYRSIHFPGVGEWSRVPVPTEPETLSMALWDVDMITADEGWAVGGQYELDMQAHAAVLHYHDGAWSAVPSPADEMLTGVDMVSADEGWAVGGTSIVHYRDGSWELLDTEAPSIVWDVEMVGPDDGWIVGHDSLLRYQGGAWHPQDVPDYAGASKLNMLSPTEGWALGGEDPELGTQNFNQFEDGSWRAVPWPLPQSLEPQSLDMSPGGRGTGWLGGSNGAGVGWLARHCEDKYEPVTTTLPGIVWDIDMMDESGTEGWAVGGSVEFDPALLMHFDDDRWTVIDSPYDGLILGIDMTSRDDGWAVGMYLEADSRGSTLLHYTGPTPPPAPDSTATATPTAGTATPTPTAPPTDSPTETPTVSSQGRIYMPSASKAPIRLNGRAGAVDAKGNTVYLADGSHLAIIDVSNPAEPWVRDRIGPLGHACVVTNVVADGENVYTSCRVEDAAIDSVGAKTTVSVLRAATDSQSATLLGALELEEWAFELTASAGWVYSGGWWCEPDSGCMGERRGGVVVIDARDPAILTRVGFVELESSFILDLLVDDRHLYAAGSRDVEGLDADSLSEDGVVYILDLLRPEAPELVATLSGDEIWQYGAAAFSITRHEDLLYVLPGPWVYDTSEPSHPTLLADMRIGRMVTPWEMLSHGDYLHVLGEINAPHQFLIVEPLDHATPPRAEVDATIVGDVSLPVPVWPHVWEDVLAVSQGYAYIARADAGGLYVIDVRDPADPKVVGEL